MSYSHGNAYGQQQSYGFNAGYGQAGVSQAGGYNVSFSQQTAQNTSNNNRNSLLFQQQGNGAAEEFSAFNGHVASQGVSSSVGNSSAEYAGQQRYRSDIEQQILRSQQPVQINESEEITVNGERGLWTNKAEVVNWRGVIPIEQYAINQDNNPEVITKRSNQHLEVTHSFMISC
jgi:hypothetical protein